MSVIAVVNRKGGSGKSTLATHLAAHFANSGVPVMLGDVDRQQSTQSWLRSRNLRDLPHERADRRLGGRPEAGAAPAGGRAPRRPRHARRPARLRPGARRRLRRRHPDAGLQFDLRPRIGRRLLQRDDGAAARRERPLQGRRHRHAARRAHACRRSARDVGARPEAALHRRAARSAGLRSLRRAGPHGVRPARRAGAGRRRAMEADRRLARADPAHGAATRAARQSVGRAAGAGARRPAPQAPRRSSTMRRRSRRSSPRRRRRVVAALGRDRTAVDSCPYRGRRSSSRCRAQRRSASAGSAGWRRASCTASSSPDSGQPGPARRDSGARADRGEFLRPPC